ncbi:hypothetical protein FH972_026267 [Carpinus fangiana]|uniref:Major facilitator superfamily (MFS) profile domain-containing protein n=1 Tax=Carpinus fangiana TaxID=176857 RepID=A0A5N6L3U6_9ROSI|nr:hypothetical protein FH972_026267 [Carpinus fangiana]
MVSPVLQRYLVRPPRYVWSSVIMAIGGALFGLDTGTIGPVTVMSQYTSGILTTDSAIIHGLVVSSILIPAALTSFLAGPLADRVGRTYGVMAGACIFALGTALEAGAVNLAMFLVGRIITGVGEGAFLSTTVVYICEIVPARHRGPLASLVQMAVTLGICVGYFVCYGTASVSSSFAWRIPFILQSIVAVTLAASCPFLPASPRWLISHGRMSEVPAVLEKLGLTEKDFGEETNELVHSVSHMERTKKAARSGFQGFRAVFEKGGRKQAIFAAFLSAMAQLAGIDGLSSSESSFLASGVSALVIFGVTIPACIMADSFKRRSSTIFGGLGMGTCMLLMGILYASNATERAPGSRWAVIVAIYIYAALYSVTWAVIFKIYASEIQPAKTRAAASALAQSSNWIANFIVALVTPVLLSKSSYGAYFMFGGCALLTAAVCTVFMPETRGKALDTIAESFDSHTVEINWFRRGRDDDKMALETSASSDGVGRVPKDGEGKDSSLGTGNSRFSQPQLQPTLDCVTAENSLTSNPTAQESPKRYEKTIKILTKLHTLPTKATLATNNTYNYTKTGLLGTRIFALMDYYRRVSTGPPAQNAVPPAPPLPPKRTSETAVAKGGLLDRFQGILGGARKSVSGSQAESTQELRSQLLYSNSYGSSKSRTTSHRTGLKIRALDINSARTHVVLAGGKILKTVRVEGSNCVEDFNIRSAAVNYAWEANAQDGKKGHRPSEDVSSVQRETFDIEDVAWSNGPNFSSHIATAASNGRIMLYDLERPVVEIGRLHEHYRQVHKVDFNPIEGRFLLSGSQDGTVRLWDLRTLQRNVMICYSRDTFPGRSDGVRHTKWSPTNTWTFALGTDNGTVQRWDTRQNKTPLLKISAHSDTCNSIDWHPDGKHLASAGKDQNVKVWNLASDRRQKPSFQIRAPKEVQNVRWRPPSYISEGSDSYVKQSTYLATSYRTLPVVHVWDLRRPFMPFREIYHNVNNGTTDMLWQSKDLLWTVGPEGEFCQTDVPFAPKTLDRRPLQSIAHSLTGDIGFFTQPLSGESVPAEEVQPDEFAIEDMKDSPSPSKKTLRATLGDDSFEERFLSTSFRKFHSRTPSVRSARSFGSTPPTAEDFAKPVVQLDETMRDFDDLAPHQLSVSGPYPGGQSRRTFSYLAQTYMRVLHQQEEDRAERFSESCKLCAQSLEKAGRLEDAEVWKLLGYDVSQWLRERQDTLHGIGEGGDMLFARKKSLPHRQQGFKASAKRIMNRNSPSTEKSISKDQSTSNVPTPIARPTRHTTSNGGTPFDDHDDVDDIEQLPPSLNPPNLTQVGSQYPEESVGNSFDSQEGWKASPSAADRRQDMLTQYRSQPKPLLDFDHYHSHPRLSSGSFHPRLDRQDSGESFMMFSTSSGSRPRLSAHNSFASSASPSMRKSGGDSWNGSEQGMLDPVQRTNSGEESTLFNATYALSETRSRSSEEEIPGDLSGSFGPTSHVPEISAQAEIRQPQDPHDSVQEADDVAIMEDNTSKEPNSSVSHDGNPPIHDLHEASASMTSSIADLTLHANLNLDEDTWLRIDMFSELLEHYASSSNAQLATQLYTICRPVLFPSTADVPAIDPDLIAHHPVLGSAYGHLITSTGFSPTTAQTIVSDTHLVLEELGIPSTMVEAFLASYHDQLMSHKLFNAAASLRQIVYPAFPAVYEQAFQSIETGLLCTYCNNPLNNPTDKTTCETCKRHQALCAVCLLPESPYDLLPASPQSRATKRSRRKAPRPLSSHRPDAPSRTPTSYPARPTTPSLKTTPRPKTPSTPLTPSTLATTKPHKTRIFTTCPLCNHAIHTSCAYAWFADLTGGGACPVEACLCDCAPGPYRADKLAAATLQAEIRRGLAAASHKAAAGPAQPSPASMAIRRDEWDVGQSRAVKSVRGALREGSGAVSDGEADPRRRPGVMAGRSSSGRGSEGGESGSAGRRVRVVGPGD